MSINKKPREHSQRTHIDYFPRTFRQDPGRRPRVRHQIRRLVEPPPKLERVPEPVLPHDPDVRLAHLIELVRVVHFVRLRLTRVRADQVRHLHGPRDLLDVRAPRGDELAVDLQPAAGLVYARDAEDYAEEGGEAVVFDALCDVDVVAAQPDFMALDDPGGPHDRYSCLERALRGKVVRG